MLRGLFDIGITSERCKGWRDVSRPADGVKRIPSSVMVVAALILSIVAIVISVAAAYYARRTTHANERSAVADTTTAALDVGRRHTELTPHLRIKCRPSNPGSDQLKLTVSLLGPPDLRQLDGLTVTVRNDHHLRGQGRQIAGGPTSEEVTAQIWGPFRFVPGTGPGADPSGGVPGADRAGRSTPTSGMPVGEELQFNMEPTSPGHWMGQTPQDWRRERGTVLRLTFECRKDGMEPWTLTGEVDTQTDNPVEVPAARS
ncbi:MAG: hypothetical protein ABIQ18_44265 [Umezawaea sp.]